MNEIKIIATSTIQCPDCGMVQQGSVGGTWPHPTFIHHCEGCDYIIMESEWQAPACAFCGEEFKQGVGLYCSDSCRQIAGEVHAYESYRERYTERKLLERFEVL
jgi:hypothetical protein